jgi:hypothetical protein
LFLGIISLFDRMKKGVQQYNFPQQVETTQQISKRKEK